MFDVWAEAAARRPAITREQVVRVALALLDEVGLGGLTMRRLAERLGIRAASLYNHVPDKLTLLALLGDTICGEIPPPDPRQPWRTQLEALAAAYRRVLLAHRDAAQVLLAAPPVGPRRLELIERTLRALRDAGFDDAAVADGGTAFNVYVTGFVLDETRGHPGHPGEDLSAAAAEQFTQWWRALPAEHYPTLAALGERLLDGDLERRFAFGFEALLDGLERRLDAQGPRGAQSRPGRARRSRRPAPEHVPSRSAPIRNTGC
jgi:AcrR family transcriptional regulator